MRTTTIVEPGVLDLRPGLEGLVAFCELIGEPLAAYQRRIAGAYFGKAREVAVILPRGCAKTTVAALIGVHHLLTVPGAAVTVGAASVAQARICFERMRGFAQHPALDGELVVRHLELRRAETGGLLRVVPSDGPRVHGLSSTLYIADELWAWPSDGELLTAMVTGLVKRPDSKLLMISTAAADLDGPLGRLRARALAHPSTKRKGSVLEARGDPHWLEWSLPEDASLDDMKAVKAANPASWITVGDLKRQRGAVPDSAFAQFHACRWGQTEGSWLPAGAWQACTGAPVFEPGEPIWIGVDVGGEHSTSAIVWTNANLHVGVQIYTGDRAILDVLDHIRDLASSYSVREVIYDPWRMSQGAQELQRERITVLEFPQTDVRMIPASQGLHSAITEQRLTLPPDPEFAAHAARAIARHSRRGWRLDKTRRTDHIDAVIALCMAVERAEHVPEPVEVLGWL